MPIPLKRLVVCCIALTFSLQLGGSSVLAADDRNTTGLPTYPHLTHAVMDPVPRDTRGRKCIHFVGNSPDQLEVVEEWYRQAFAGASESDISDDPLYGDYFKLVGIKLVRGNDFATVYREETGRSTSIELFSCMIGRT
jgi:hypothetical protein